MDPTLTAAAIGVGGTVIIGVVGFWANVRNTNKTTALTLRAVELAEQGQVADRYTKAIEQLGSDKLDVRIGGIYALERIARDSATDHPTVMEVLVAFIREHCREQLPPSASKRPKTDASARTTRPDVQAALTLIGRRDARRDREPINLSDAYLSGVNLTGADLADAKLTGANLVGAYLNDANLAKAHFGGADLTHAGLWHANLTGAQFHEANLSGAWLIDAHLTDAHLYRANLTGANLSGVNLSGAYLGFVQLTGANFSGANFSGTDLTGADLTGAKLTGAKLTTADVSSAPRVGMILAGGLAGANLSRAIWPTETPVPEGWVRDPNSGQLSRAHPR